MQLTADATDPDIHGECSFTKPKTSFMWSHGELSGEKPGHDAEGNSIIVTVEPPDGAVGRVGEESEDTSDGAMAEITFTFAGLPVGDWTVRPEVIATWGVEQGQGCHDCDCGNCDEGAAAFAYFSFSVIESGIEGRDVKIYFAGGDVTGETSSVVAGKEVSLTMKLDPAAPAPAAGNISVEWTLQGSPLKDYIFEKATGDAQMFSDAERKVGQIDPKWTADGVFEVRVTVAIGDQSESAATTVRVIRPDSQFTSTTVNTDPPPAVFGPAEPILPARVFFPPQKPGVPRLEWVGLSGVDDEGIVWDASVTTKADEVDMKGEIGMLQLINFREDYHIKVGTGLKYVNPLVAKEEAAGVDEEYLDTNSDSPLLFDDPAKPRSIGPSETRQMLRNGTIELLHDSPRSPLEDYIATLRRSEEFKTFLMYKPDGSGSVWVPLKRLDWGWSVTCVRDEPRPSPWNYFVTAAALDSKDPSGFNTTELPEWTATTEEARYHSNYILETP